MTRYGVPPRVAYVVADAGTPRVFLMPLPDGPPLVLADTAAVIWILAADGERDVPAAVGDVVGRPREAVADEVDAYLADLLAKGLITRTK